MSIKPNFTFRNSRGFSLVEVTIAAGIMGALSLATMQIFKENAKSQKRSETSLEAQSLINSIQTTLLNKESCEHTLNNIPVVNGSKVNKIKNRMGATLLGTSLTYGNAIKIDSMWLDDSSIVGGYGEASLKPLVIIVSL